LESSQYFGLKICLEDLTKLNNEYIKFKISNNKKRGKKKKFAEFIRNIATVSIENSQNEEDDSKMNIILSPKNTHHLEVPQDMEITQTNQESREQDTLMADDHQAQSISINVHTIYIPNN
jgi:phosphatidylserine decarboxylase